MAVLSRHRHCLSAAIAILFFATALGSGLMGIASEEGDERSLSRRDEEWEMARRRLAGPGSSPPTCRARCGRCLPCRPVHVAIQPGRSAPMEYYPEAWRCKCGNKLFMP